MKVKPVPAFARPAQGEQKALGNRMPGEAELRPPLPPAQQLEANLPPEVLALTAWLPWLGRPRRGGGVGKVPALPRGGRLAPVDGRKAGLPWPEALALARQHGAGGVGVVLRPGDSLTVLDLDGPLGAGRQAVLNALPGYAEVSPSGTGVHLWLAGSLPASRRSPGLELLARGYVTVTARPLPGRGRALCPLAQVLEVCGRGEAGRPPTRLPPAPAGATRGDPEVLAALYSARNGARARQLLEGDWQAHPSPSEADFAAVRIIRFHTVDPAQIERLLRASGLNRAKYDAPGYLARTIDRALALGGPTKEQP